MSNTCTIDSFLAIFTGVVSFDNPELVHSLGVLSTDQESALINVLERLQSGQVNEAKDAWVDCLISVGIVERKRELSLWGCCQTLFLSLFEHVYRFTEVTICGNGDFCPKFRIAHRPCNLLAVKYRTNFDDLESLVSVSCPLRDCVETVTEKDFSSHALFLSHSRQSTVFDAESEGEDTTEYVCSGRRVVESRELPNHCWLLPLNVRAFPKSKIFSELPTEIRAGSKIFHLRGIVFFKPGHYYCYIRSFERWYFYCGDEAPKGRRVLDVVCSGKPEIALYTL